MKRFEFGPRFMLPVLYCEHIARWTSSHLAPATTSLPIRRSLWVYAIDPADVGLRDSGVSLDMPYEFLEPGPRGALFAVDPLVPERFMQMLDWSEAKRRAFLSAPTDLNQAEIALQGGYRPSTGNPRFAAQMSYAVCMHVHERFSSALGRCAIFGPFAQAGFRSNGRVQLLIRTHGLPDEDNAYYDPNKGALLFGFHENRSTQSTKVGIGSVQQYVLSQDMICHELAHALIDGMRAHFMEPTGPDVAAFHEGFADLIALLHHFTSGSLVRQAIEETGDIGLRALLEIGRLLGETDTPMGGNAMRTAMSALVKEASPEGLTAEAWTRDLTSMVGEANPILTMIDPESGKPWTECHDRGAVLAVAVMEAFVVCFRQRARPYRRLARAVRPSDSQGLPTELVDILAGEVARLASHFLRMLIRALDYCPPVDITFGEFLRALITADQEFVPLDGRGYRAALIRAFRRRAINIEHVLDLSEASLVWSPPRLELPPIPGLAYSELRLTNDGRSPLNEIEQRRWGQALMDFVLASAERVRSFGLRIPGGQFSTIIVESICLTNRLDERRVPQRGIVAELIQTRTGRTGRPFLGGCTIIVDERGMVRYTICKSVDSLRRRGAQRRYLLGRDPGTETLKAIHARRRRV